MRLLLVLCLALFVCAPAFAQGPTGAAGPVPEAEDTPDDVVRGDDEVADDDVDSIIDDDAPGCGGADGTDGDYTYCGCDVDTVGTEGDYVYCAAGEGGPRTDKPENGGQPQVVAATTPQALPASTLPMTGDNPITLAMIGLGFVLVGAGGRLTLRSRS